MVRYRLLLPAHVRHSFFVVVVSFLLLCVCCGAKRDAAECGQYLCPAFPDSAEEYISSGCQGDFTMSSSFAVKEDERSVSKKMLGTVASVSAGAALVVGFVAGRREQARRRNGYLPVKTIILD